MDDITSESDKFVKNVNARPAQEFDIAIFNYPY